MEECQVYQVIFFREKLALFAEHEHDGGGSMFTLAGTGEAPRYAEEHVEVSPFRHPRYAGSKLLGTMRRDEIGGAWQLCAAYVEENTRKDEERKEKERKDEERKDEERKDKDDGPRHPDITTWCVAVADLLVREGAIVMRPWWEPLPTKRGA
ncbi:hypothetical protein ISF_04993 [Cordyceps fumosorosea ARSEF 2679]|uniref:Uncharacterized protein n=1 Tax=Cordyceps fumosorosea (strain ARSEF 2679) TaxID=1081104 RepID=A0A167VYC1_CORFA|nr:hypothetical protein ISF_04993 [Cordyceps fumosorosea ARSEF 2679]OAA63117.1 hypothetical protein ISF_04993 [Cordyceps fumosorosea ARSEF 2679]